MFLSIVQFEKLMIIKLKSHLYLCCGLSLAEGNPWCLITWFSSGYDSTSAINLNYSEIALNSKCHISTYTQAFHCRDTLHLNLWMLKAGSTVHIFPRAVICFLSV